ncbi:MAG: acetyl-CoA synthetase [Candidatus Binatia bacterium]|nr:MAG: acetyl-CoA synthetase [Candidatus Binatia bacterium]
MRRTLSEFESKRRLAPFGIPFPREELARSPEEAARTAASVGFPVALKACGEGLAHKTERGLVVLDLRDGPSVERAAREILGRIGPEDGEVELLVSRMVPGRRELIAGCTRDETFGPCILLGLGGIFAEVLRRVTFRLLPIERVDAEEMLEELEDTGFFGEFRGEPPADREALVSLLLGLAGFASSDPSVLAVDLNPVVLSEGRPVAVDALVEVGES